MNSGQKLWQEAKQLIPGGNQLLSKRAERFLPEQWPTYYSRARGCEVWDMDDNHYYDFAQMGVGACVLGYAHDEVNKAVLEAIAKGNMCTLNSPEEVQLAKVLVNLHPWAEQARFARTGGEACAIAIRIARAATGKGRIAFCGYHGWHDWYISSNLADDSNLDGQLLPGLQPAGVYRGLKESALPFNYNKPEELEALFANHKDIGVVIMEPQRSSAPAPGFLEAVRKLVSRNNAVLIFDEVTSGFRMNMGGIHLTYGVEPDMAVFGKALGNGYPIAAIIGSRKVMDAAQNTFISSTMWTERIGFTAALATINTMANSNVPARLISYGERVTAIWRNLAMKHSIAIATDGIPPLTHLQFTDESPLATTTLYTQTMLELGFLAGAAVYTTDAYNAEILDKFETAVDATFATIATAQAGSGVLAALKGPVIQSGFKRLS